jgi:hypothetical protein
MHHTVCRYAPGVQQAPALPSGAAAAAAVQPYPSFSTPTHPHLYLKHKEAAPGTRQAPALPSGGAAAAAVQQPGSWPGGAQGVALVV